MGPERTGFCAARGCVVRTRVRTAGGLPLHRPHCAQSARRAASPPVLGQIGKTEQTQNRRNTLIRAGVWGPAQILMFLSLEGVSSAPPPSSFPLSQGLADDRISQEAAETASWLQILILHFKVGPYQTCYRLHKRNRRTSASMMARNNAVLQAGKNSVCKASEQSSL